jgi:hypothetical protein
MQEAKIQFSPPEMDLLNNAAVILTKNTVLEKIRQLFMELQSEMQSVTEASQQQDLSIPPKISRGEHYRGLPYMILDFPRVFRGNDIYAIRTMFWWGHYFSITLHLSGHYKEKLQGKLAARLAELGNAGYSISIHPDQWLHHYNEEVYTTMKGMDENAFHYHCNKHPHLKMGKTYPLEEMETVIEKLLKEWRYLLEVSLA